MLWGSLFCSDANSRATKPQRLARGAGWVWVGNVQTHTTVAAVVGLQKVWAVQSHLLVQSLKPTCAGCTKALAQWNCHKHSVYSVYTLQGTLNTPLANNKLARSVVHNNQTQHALQGRTVKWSSASLAWAEIAMIVTQLISTCILKMDLPIKHTLSDFLSPATKQKRHSTQQCERTKTQHG